MTSRIRRTSSERSSARRSSWGFNEPELFKLLEKGPRYGNSAQRAALYQQANNYIMTQVYGVPYAHTKPALAFKKTVLGYVPSPTSSESFASVRKTA